MKKFTSNKNGSFIGSQGRLKCRSQSAGRPVCALLLASMLGFSSQVSAEFVDCNVVDPDPGTNMLIEYGDSVSCVFEEKADVDVYRFVANAGDKPFITLVSPSARMFLSDPAGNEIARTSTTSVARIIDEVLENDGIHTLVVEAHSNSVNWDYTLEIPCLAGRCTVNPVPNALGYTAVPPCRIVDTRFGIGGVMSHDETRHFRTYGDITNQNSAAGGAPANYPEECPFALGEHAAVHLNVTVVPMNAGGQDGFVTLWPHGEAQPNTSWINFRGGVQNVANAGTVKTRVSDRDTPDISVFTFGDAHLIIDVMGYYTE